MDRPTDGILLSPEFHTDVAFFCPSLKVQQGLLVDFASFPQKFIDLLNLCYSEQESENPR